MKKIFILFLFAGIILSNTQAHSQTVDSVALAKSQQRIESDLKDAEKHQRKIEKKQRRIEKQQKKIKRQERKRERRMRKIEKEQRKADRD
ncbi:MAG: hypothetical protein ABR502_10190 [Chitinophagaceae bacterium]